MVFVYEANQSEHNPSLCEREGDGIAPPLPPPASCFLILLSIFVRRPASTCLLAACCATEQYPVVVAGWRRGGESMGRNGTPGLVGVLELRG